MQTQWEDSTSLDNLSFAVIKTKRYCPLTGSGGREIGTGEYFRLDGDIKMRNRWHKYKTQLPFVDHAKHAVKHSALIIAFILTPALQTSQSCTHKTKEALVKGLAKSHTTTGLPDFETRASPKLSWWG